MPFVVGVEEPVNVRGSDGVICRPIACVLTFAAGNDWYGELGEPRGRDGLTPLAPEAYNSGSSPVGFENGSPV